MSHKQFVALGPEPRIVFRHFVKNDVEILHPCIFETTYRVLKLSTMWVIDKSQITPTTQNRQ